ncbi:MAG: metallophosphoesterase [Clostridia bacterium]|nr:metallophosphoesterase [Clostridia bacterium]
MTNEVNFDDNNIAVSFCVMSDVHITSAKEDDQCSKNYKNAMDLAYKYSKTGKLDFVLVAGDIAQNIAWDKTYGEHLYEIDAYKVLTDKYLRDGTALVFCTGNHDRTSDQSYEKEFTKVFTSTQADIDRYYKYDVDMESVMNYSGNRHAVVNGYHFISVAMFGDYVSYMKPLLDEITAKEPLKPVFVSYHYHAAETVYATHYGKGIDDLRELLNNYPQVVFFSGHSHNALDNPRAIWQGEFTAIDTASLRYLDDNSLIRSNIKIPVNATHSEVFRYASEAMLVEVDTEGNVRFTCYHTNRGDIVAIYTVGAPKADNSHLLKYTQEREKLSKPPVFKDAAFKLTQTDSGDVNVHFNQAVHDDIVWYYTIKFKAETEETQKFYFTSRYHDLNGMPDTIDCILLSDINMPDNDNHKGFGAHKLTPGVVYTAVLEAYDVWDHPSEPVAIRFEYK